MAIERAAILYPRNSTTVDTGTGIDVRVLDDVDGGTIDATQTATATHTQDSVERTFDPATGGVTNTNNAGTTLFTMGWGLRLAEDMTPVDDTNCNAYLPAGTLSVALNVAVAWGGATTAALTGTVAATWRASLWRYNVSANTGTLIAAGSVATPTWDVAPITGDPSGTVKQATISINVATAVEFLAGEILLLQVGLNTGSLPDAVLGTQTYTFTLQVGTANTKITWAANQGIRQFCFFTSSLVGKGVVSRGANLISLSKNVVGKGVVTGTKATVASKSFNLVGKGVITEIHPVQAFRTFNLIGKGEILRSGANTSTITIPIDEVPEVGGSSVINNIIYAVID